MAANLRRLRSVAQEIIIGADENVSTSDLRWYSKHADTLATYPFTGANEFRAWLRGLASGEWILFLDGDELASDTLIRQLPTMLSTRDIGAYALNTRWVYPTSEYWLAQRPWNPDWHVRLVRNDDRLWFPSQKHTGPAYFGPTRRVDAPLLHLDLLLRSHQERVAKVARYDEESIGLMVFGSPINAAYYLPEETSGVTVSKMTVIDTALVGRSMRALRRRSRHWSLRRRVDPVRATIADIGATLPWTPMSGDSAKADIRIVDAPTRVLAGTHFWVRINVVNRGDRVWPFGETHRPLIRCSYHWFAAERVVVSDGLRTLLPHGLHPGQSGDLDILVQAPVLSGTYDLVPDIVSEGERWFGSTRSCPIYVDDPPAHIAQEVSAEGKMSLSDAWALRRRISVEDSLSWYLSSAATSRQPEIHPGSVTPQMMESRVEKAGPAVVRCLHDNDAAIVFSGDAELLVELIEGLRDAGHGKRSLVVIPTGATNEGRMLACVKAASAESVTVASLELFPVLEADQSFTCVIGFHNRPLATGRLNSLQRLRKHVATPQRILVMNACSDLSLSIMNHLESTALCSSFQVLWDGGCVAEGRLLPPQELQPSA